jgi:hypothetical protein
MNDETIGAAPKQGGCLLLPNSLSHPLPAALSLVLFVQYLALIT